MGRAIGIGTSIGKGTTGAVGAAPGNVSGLTVTGFIDPTTLAITLQVQVTPPSDTGDTITGGHLYLEVPDQSSGASFIVGTNTVGDGSTTVGPWTPIDCGIQAIAALAAGVTVTIPGPPGINASENITCRLYVNSVGLKGENKLIRANLANPTPSEVFTLTSLASGTPTSGTNVATLTTTTGPIAIVATALDPVNVTGKLETPVIVSVSNVPVVPKGENRLGLGQWCYQLVLTYAGQDPTVPANQFVAAAGPFYSAGIVGQSLYELASADGVSEPHSFLLATPTAVTNAIVWLQAGTVNAAGVFTGNNIVPGITPSFPIEYGSTIGTTDASSIMAATIAASMTIVDGLFGVATAGITNSLLGSGAVATINIQALAITNPLLASLAVASANIQTGAITNPLLASLAVEAANLAANSVATANIQSGAVGTTQIASAAITSALIATAAVGTAAIQNAAITSALIASAAVGTAAIQTAAITNALIANAAISGAQIQSATITGANIASATIAGANIGSATITGANIASATIAGANIQSATITDANISTCSVSKLTAGTLSATVSITSPTITCTNGFEVTTGGITTTISNGAFSGFNCGLQVNDNTAYASWVYPRAIAVGTNAGANYSLLGVNLSGEGWLQLFNSSNVLTVELTANSTFGSATAGSATLPSNPVEFWEVIIGGNTRKIPLYAA